MWLRLNSLSFVSCGELFAQTRPRRSCRRGGEPCQLMPLRNANNNMKSPSMGAVGEGVGTQREECECHPQMVLSPRSREQSAQLNRCFDCVQDNEVLLRPTGCESQVALPKPLEMPDRAPGAAGGTTGPVPGMVAMSARPLEEVGGGSQTEAAALRIDWIDDRIEAEQQKWVSLQAPAQPGPDRSARGRLAGCRGGGCRMGRAERLEKNLRVKMTPLARLPPTAQKMNSPS